MVDAPQFSLIVPTHNRERLLTACLDSVLVQSFPAAYYEVIVVDDGSRRRTARTLEPYQKSGSVRVLHQPRLGWSAARWLGVLHSRGEIVVFIDDDCMAPPGWLSSYAQVYATHSDVDGVAGGLRPGPHINVAGYRQYAGHLDYFNRLNEPLNICADQAGRAWFTFGGNRSFRREIWLAAQPVISLWYYDDYAVDLKLRDLDAFVYYEPEAWVYHHYKLSVPQRIRAAYRYGQSEQVLKPPFSHESRRTWLERWQDLKSDVPDASFPARTWYAATQPLAWLARRLGQLAAR